MGGGIGLGASLFGQGKDPVSKFMGIGQQGDYYKPGELQGAAQKQFGEATDRGMREIGAMRDPNLARSMASYSQGDTSLADMLGEAGGGEHAAGRLQEFATNPLAASRFAQEQVGSGPLTGRLYGQEDSLMSDTLGRLGSAESSLYENRPEEAEEYGQVSGDIARRSGQQEQGLAQALAQRGLGAAPSGVGQAAFTGQLGSKYEQLGRAQSDLRQRTINQRMQNLQGLRNMSQGLAAQQHNALGQQLDTQFRGRQASEGARAQRMGEGQSAAQMEYDRNIMGENLKQASMAAQSAAKTPTLGQAFGRGLTSSFQSFGAAPGQFASSAAGAAGGGMGGGGAAPTAAPAPKKTTSGYNDYPQGRGAGG